MNQHNGKKRIVFIVTVAMSAEKFLIGFLPTLRATGLLVTIISSDSSSLRRLTSQEQADFIPVEIARNISLIADVKALLHLWWILIKLKPNLVNASTPKAGLLGTVAALFAGIPIRIFQQRGLRLETATGVRYWILYFFEKLTALCATHVICNSKSLCDAYIKLNLAPKAKLSVIGSGSSHGVDTSRFHPNKYVEDAIALQQKLGLGSKELVIGFFGRLTRDKGVDDLVSAFIALPESLQPVRLLLMGSLEKGDPIAETTLHQIQNDERIITVGYVDDPTVYYQLLDILAFPSYREGLPNVPLEAAASGIPTVGYQATGTRDAVLNNESGLLVPVGDIPALRAALHTLLVNSSLRQQFSRQAREYAVSNFDSHLVHHNWVQFYQSCTNI